MKTSLCVEEEVGGTRPINVLGNSFPHEMSFPGLVAIGTKRACDESAGFRGPIHQNSHPYIKVLDFVSSEAVFERLKGMEVDLV